MRISRMLFGLPFACLALACALTFLSPTRSLEYGPGLTSVSWQAPDLTLPVVYIDHVAMVAEDVPVDKPADAHLAVYTVANQPLASWRLAADAYRHIDPHIQVG